MTIKLQLNYIDCFSQKRSGTSWRTAFTWRTTSSTCSGSRSTERRGSRSFADGPSILQEVGLGPLNALQFVDVVLFDDVILIFIDVGSVSFVENVENVDLWLVFVLLIVFGYLLSNMYFFVVYVDFVIFVVEFEALSSLLILSWLLLLPSFMSVLVLHIGNDLTPELKTLIYNST